MAWFEPDERPTINGINAVAFNVGTGIILWQMSDFNDITGSWKNTLILFSLMSLALSLAWLLVKDKTNDSARANSQTEPLQVHYSYKDGLKDKFNWIYALTYSGILAFYICLFTFYPKAGISQSALVIGSGIVGTLAGVFYSKKISTRVPVIRWSGLIITLTVMGGLSFGQSDVLQTSCAMVLGFLFSSLLPLLSLFLMNYRR